VHSAVTPGESRFRLRCNGALVMGINAKLRRDINSPDFSTCLLLIQLVLVAVELTSYHSLYREDIKSHIILPGIPQRAAGEPQTTSNTKLMQTAITQSKARAKENAKVR